MNQRLILPLTCLSLATLGLCSCASLFMGDQAVATQRGPASVEAAPGSVMVYDQTTGLEIDPVTQAPIGADLGRNEFSRQTNVGSERARAGYRRNASPWDGTGPVNEGSLWNPESQDGFFFTRNLLHKVGDVLIVKVENDVNLAVNNKIESILGRQRLQDVIADEAGKTAEEKVSEKVGKAVGNERVGDAVGKAVGDRAVASLESKAAYVQIDEVPVRIVEVLPRNTFRVEGTRRITVMDAPYTFKLSGMVRDEDIGNVSMVSSEKVFESKMELTK